VDARKHPQLTEVATLSATLLD